MEEVRWSAVAVAVGARHLHLALGLRVERRRRLVEDDHLGRLEERARDADALALAAAQPHAALAHRRLQPERQRARAVEELRGAHRLLHLGVGRRRRVAAHRAVPHVCGEVGVEEHGVLREEGWWRR